MRYSDSTMKRFCTYFSSTTSSEYTRLHQRYCGLLCVAVTATTLHHDMSHEPTDEPNRTSASSCRDGFLEVSIGRPSAR